MLSRKQQCYEKNSTTRRHVSGPHSLASEARGVFEARRPKPRWARGSSWGGYGPDGRRGSRHLPHHKFETPIEIRLTSLQGTDHGRTAVIPEAFIIYHGASHEKMTAFQLADVRESHWSTKPMSYDDVRAIFGRIRAERRAR
jgi:hypothetical protein